MNNKSENCLYQLIFIGFVIMIIIIIVLLISSGHLFDPGPAFDDW